MEEESKGERIFSLKWMVENFGFFYIKNFNSLSFIHSNPFTLPLGDHKNELQLAFRLYPNGCYDCNQNYLSLNMHMLSEAQLAIKRCEIYLQDYNLEKHLIFKNDNFLLSKDNDFNLEQFVQKDQIYERGYLVKDVLTLICKIYINDNCGFSKSIEINNNNNDKDDDDIENELESRSNARVKVSRIEQKWQIDKFDARCQLNDKIPSPDYQWDNNISHLSYCLYLHPNGMHSNVTDHVSLVLHIKLTEQLELRAQSQLSICDPESNKHNTKVIHGKLISMGLKDFCCPKYIGHAEIGKHLHEDTLDIFCEIEVFHEEILNENLKCQRIEQPTSSNRIIDMTINITESIANCIITENGSKAIFGKVIMKDRRNV